MTIRTLLFDLDGTLLDSFDLIIASFHHTRLVHFGDRLDDDYYRRGIGTTLAAQFTQMCNEAEVAKADVPARVAEMIATYKEHNLANHDEQVRAYPGVSELFEALRKNESLALALVTSKMRDGALRGLACLHLEHDFGSIVCGDDVTHGKPHPEPVLRALDELARPTAGALMIGDSPHDLGAARAAGVDSAACAWGPFDHDELRRCEPTHWLERPSDLLTLLG